MPRQECTTVRFYEGERLCGELIACDQHGNGRSNKVWTGAVQNADVDLPNLKAVAEFAKFHSLRFEKVKQ